MVKWPAWLSFDPNDCDVLNSKLFHSQQAINFKNICGYIPNMVAPSDCPCSLSHWEIIK